MPLLAEVTTTPSKAIHLKLAKPTSKKPAAEKHTAKAILKLKQQIKQFRLTKNLQI